MKNPAIPENSEVFSERDGVAFVFFPYGGNVKIEDVVSGWRPWIAAMAIEEFQAMLSDIAGDAYEGCDDGPYRELSAGIRRWRAWGKA